MPAPSPIATSVRVAVIAMLLWLAPVAAPVGAQPTTDFVSVTDAMLQDPAPSDWLMWRRTLDSWGYSPLDEINRENVNELRLVWTRDLADGTSEGTPLAYGGVLYMPQAKDAFDHETGGVLWEINLGTSVSGYPITYAVDGRQYVAVNTGGGSINLTPELHPSSGSNLFVFALPDRD